MIIIDHFSSKDKELFPPEWLDLVNNGTSSSCSVMADTRSRMNEFFIRS
jgi:hypothetical protein